MVCSLLVINYPPLVTLFISGNFVSTVVEVWLVHHPTSPHTVIYKKNTGPNSR